MSAPAPVVRQARSYLRDNLKAGTGDVSPRLFANASHETGLKFDDLATLLARLYSGGQNADFYREAALEQNLARED